MSIVCTPGLLGESDLSDIRTLEQLPWLQELGTDEVSDVAAMLGFKTTPRIAAQMPGNLIHDALRRGDGLTYTPSIFVDEEIEAGTLVELKRFPGFGHFYIALAHGAPRRSVRTFLRWLRAQAAG